MLYILLCMHEIASISIQKEKSNFMMVKNLGKMFHAYRIQVVYNRAMFHKEEMCVWHLKVWWKGIL